MKEFILYTFVVLVATFFVSKSDEKSSDPRTLKVRDLVTTSATDISYTTQDPASEMLKKVDEKIRFAETMLRDLNIETDSTKILLSVAVENPVKMDSLREFLFADTTLFPMLTENLHSDILTAEKNLETTFTKISKTEDLLKNLMTYVDSTERLRYHLVENAKNYLKYPYVWGGTTPTPGFDCSGFVYYLYNGINYKLPRVTYEMVNHGREVPIEDLTVGDVLFFRGVRNNFLGIGHVGIVISQKGEPVKFIHASGKKVGVIISEFDDLYQRRFKYARRYLISDLTYLCGIEQNSTITKSE